jgi:imidazolonepropionase-like amidohydrolase
MHDELAIMVKYGLTPQQALICSIINGPAFFNQSKLYGAVAKQKNADLLILNANPLLDINNTKKIDAVVNKGKYLSRNYLDKLLADTEQKVKLLK